MVLLSQIKTAAEKKGWRFQEDSSQIGVEIYPYCWYWWMILREGACISDHIYSQNTGKSSTSMRRFIAAEDRIISTSIYDVNENDIVEELNAIIVPLSFKSMTGVVAADLYHGENGGPARLVRQYYPSLPNGRFITSVKIRFQTNKK